ncbi:hypothetical protein RchiOBHm_Chr4g0387631 [Rosa chinensis]|uniref:Uncharacterized protein n=1 Tax=Rosa chinensis TaxID=74649 RepID=A0A2P6QPI9_ROSCH|nr:hypothetical protein RchiOBHm_Chr4g0387631 [Rosa chinensis]
MLEQKKLCLRGCGLRVLACLDLLEHGVEARIEVLLITSLLLQLLRSNDDEAMRSNVLDKLRVERVGEKETMEEKQHWELSSFTRQANQKRFRRRNRNT